MLKTRVNSSIRSLALPEKIWQVFNGRNRQLYLTHKYIFLQMWHHSRRNKHALERHKIYCQDALQQQRNNQPNTKLISLSLVAKLNQTVTYSNNLRNGHSSLSVGSLICLYSSSL